jgi:benzylsuccinate CoA-transferase BbsF subunit
MVPHGVFRCVDRHSDDPSWIAIAIQNDEQWARLRALMGHPDVLAGCDITSIEGRLVAREAIERHVEDWVRPQAADELETLLQARGIPAYVAVSLRDAKDDPQFAAWGHFVSIEHPIASQTVVEGPRYKLSDTPARRPAAAPLFGEHTEYVAREILNYSRERIEKMIRAGVLHTGDPRRPPG